MDLARDLLARYAAIIEAHGLCPYLRDPSTRAIGLGEVIVMAEPEPDLECAVQAIEATSERIVHLIYPNAPREVAHPFERFGNAVAARVARRGWVHAAFHPAMTGGREDRDRQIGLLRRSPDPLLQLVPAGLPPKPQPIRDLDAVLAALDELRAHAAATRATAMK